MSVLAIYAFIALTTALTSLYELLAPVISQRKGEGFVVDNIVIIYVTFFFVSLVLTPAVLASCLIPSTGEIFRKGLYRGLFSEE